MDLNLREMVPLSHNNLLTIPVKCGSERSLLGYRGWLVKLTNPKDERRLLLLLLSVQDSAKSGLGFNGNHCLNHLAEFTFMNVGGPHRNVKASSPPMSGVSVGGSIVVRGWESQPHGQGSQRVNILPVEIKSKSDEVRTRRPSQIHRMALRRIGLCLTHGEAMNSNDDDNLRGNSEGGKLTLGEPGAVKVARPVRKGGCRNVQKVTRYVPTLRAPWYLLAASLVKSRRYKAANGKGMTTLGVILAAERHALESPER